MKKIEDEAAELYIQKKKTAKKMIIKQRGDGNKSSPSYSSSDVVTPLLDEDARAADSYFPLDVAYQASCGSNLLFRLEVQEYEQPGAATRMAKKQEEG